MFWNKTNSARIDLLAADVAKIKQEVTRINLDLELYVAKLKGKLGLKSVKEELEKEEEKPKDIYGGMFLTEDGKSHSSFRTSSRS